MFVRLGPVVGRVELPHVVVEGRAAPASITNGVLWRVTAGPALVVDPAVAEHLEVLQVVRSRPPRVVEGVQHARPVQRLLLDAVDEVGRREPGRLEDGRRDVDDVSELAAHLPLGLEPVGPVHDGAVAGAAPVRGDLLGPLVGRVHGVGPADGVVVVGVGTAEVVDVGSHRLGGLELGRAVEHHQLVERALDGALGARPVVADDVVDERVVEDAQVLQRVEQATGVEVGVLQEAGVDLHLTGQDRLEVVGHVVPRGDLRRPGRELGVRRDDPEVLLARRRSPRGARPTRRRSDPCTWPTTLAAPGAARGSPRGPST